MYTRFAPVPARALKVEPRAASCTWQIGSEGLRPDIQGLRAFAVLAVFVYHLNPKWMPGGFSGVDVFFVISGFLITHRLVGEVQRTGRLSLAGFWGRRILRLIPAATVVLVATAGMVMATVPRTGWVRFGADFAAAAGYSLNWVLAMRSVDYAAWDLLASPVQHYWSLAVEEQFYLLWPVAILGLLVGARRLGVRPVRLLLGCVISVATLSFGYAVSRVAIGDTSVFFVTTSRLWELSIGSIAALTISRVHATLNALARGAAVVVGLVLMVVAVVIVDDTRWPGWLALVPTIGAACALIGGGRIHPRGVERLLTTRLLVWVGGLSYALYLWHWPVINLAHRRWGAFTPAQYVVVSVASFALASLTQRYVENPTRSAPWFRARTRRPFALAAMCLAISMLLSTTLVLFGPRLALVPLDARPGGARVLPNRIDLATHAGWSRNVKWAVPGAADAARDLPRAYLDGCQRSSLEADPRSCVYGDPASDRLVAVVGDSKVLQWLPALEVWATERRFKILTYTKSTCPLADINVLLPNGQPYPSCREWYSHVMAELARVRPSLVMTSQWHRDGVIASNNAPAIQPMVAGLERTWSALTGAGIPVAVLADTPHPPNSISDCVIEFDRDLERCEYSRNLATAASALPSQLAALNNLGGGLVDASGNTQAGTNRSLMLFDLTDAICPDLRDCPPVVGNVFIYRSGSHITRTYIGTTTDRLSRLLDDARLL